MQSPKKAYHAMQHYIAMHGSLHIPVICMKSNFARGGCLRPKIRCLLHAPLHMVSVPGTLKLGSIW
eukprot:1002941-Pelagomonas_calceolata.AAC.3